MLVYLVLLLAALSRFFPLALHGIGLNVTAVGGGLLFFGARRPRREIFVAAILMALTDVYLTSVAYHLPFHVREYIVTWAWYAGVCLIGSGLLKVVSPWRVVLGVLSSATSFFLLSNLVVWMESAMYPHSAAGLLSCYGAAVPFYANDLVSTGLTATVLFGLPVVAAQLVQASRNGAASRNLHG